MGSEIPEAPQSVLSNEETAVVFSWARISVSGRNRGTSPVSDFLRLPSRRPRSYEKLETSKSGPLLTAYPFGGEWPS